MSVCAGARTASRQVAHSNVRRSVGQKRNIVSRTSLFRLQTTGRALNLALIMKAIQIHAVGGPDVLELINLADPVARPGEALIRIEASGVNFIDTYFREGRYPATLPYTLGQEAAGPSSPSTTRSVQAASRSEIAWRGAAFPAPTRISPLHHLIACCMCPMR